MGFFGADEEKGDWRSQTILKKSTDEYLLRRVYVSHCSITLQAVIVHNARVGEVSPFFGSPKSCQQTIGNCDKSKLYFLCQSQIYLKSLLMAVNYLHYTV